MWMFTAITKILCGVFVGRQGIVTLGQALNIINPLRLNLLVSPFNVYHRYRLLRKFKINLSAPKGLLFK
jgi:ABC-type Co2+ transport system permease subunit